MAERQKYEQWLRDLEAKRDSTPEKVFERVHADYTERLQEALDGLRQHTTTLQEHARSLMMRLKEAEVAEEDLREEQAENELRSQVGELSEDDWESGKKKADKLIAKFKEDQEKIADDLLQIREILHDATGLPTDTPASGIPRTSTDFDELAFLKSVVGAPTPQSTSSAKPAGTTSSRTSQPKPAITQPPATSTVAYPPPASASSNASVSAEPAASQPDPEPPPAARAPEPLIEQPKIPEKSVGLPETPHSVSKVDVVSDTPATVMRSSRASGSDKTLKCPECGTMNYSSEWYCERCGAELANI